MRHVFWLIALAACGDPVSETGEPGETNASSAVSGEAEDTAVDTASSTTESTTYTTPDVDTDGDGVLDGDDNCPEVYNPNQENMDGDVFGDACDLDRDGDAIPDDHDLFPVDSTRPGRADGESIYAHTSTDLYAMDPLANGLAHVGRLRQEFGSNLNEVTDLAINRHGVVYAMTFWTLYICSGRDAVCWSLGDVPGDSNGLTFVPAGTVDPVDDALIVIGQDGTWRQLHVDLVSGSVTSNALGNYGGQIYSSGDAFAMEDWGTWATVDDGSDSGPDTLVAVDPVTGAATVEIADLAPYARTYGLAGMFGRFYAFDESGDILQIDESGVIEDIIETPYAWWGAGVITVEPPP